MIVDDSAVMIKNLTEMYKNMGHKVVYACKSGNTACLEYGNYNPDIVSMDITMPDMNGIEATRKILGQYPDAKIIMVTSHGQEELVMEAIQAGIKGYVLKPIKLEKLKEVVDRIIEKMTK